LDAPLEIDRIHVIIADDQQSTRRALKAFFAFEPRITVIGEACSGEEAVQLVSKMHPDLVLMDVQMPNFDGLKATRAIKASSPDIKVVVYTIYPEYQEEAIWAGADYFMIKGSSDSSPSEVIISLFPLEES
jgi:DNA-binding NarL/FixJ family response regulator